MIKRYLLRRWGYYPRLEEYQSLSEDLGETTAQLIRYQGAVKNLSVCLRLCREREQRLEKECQMLRTIILLRSKRAQVLRRL